MEKPTAIQSRGWQNPPEKIDAPSTRDALSRKELEKTAEVLNEKPPLSLTDDLPTEIRLNIYKHLFNVPDKFFELHITSENCTSRFTNSYSVLLAQIGGLRMMRVCKKIRGEVAEYFYGGNSFRSSLPNSVLFMSCFFHTIGNFNCSFLKHVTLQMPNPWVDAPCFEANIPSFHGWDKIIQRASRQGLRNHDCEYQPKYNRDARSWGEYYYDETMRGLFSKLRDMPNLKKLEFMIPARRCFFNSKKCASTANCAAQKSLHCHCPGGGIQTMSPDDRTRHIFRDHSELREYLDLLADLKETTVSGDLKIALVFLYPQTRHLYPHHSIMMVKFQQMWEDEFRCREGIWTAAYATIMGYELGHARWDQNDKEYMT